MDGFSYHNIFETKGIEYIVILSFFAILIPFWILLNRRVNVRQSVQKFLGTLTAGALKIPQGLYFSKNHTWTFLERSGAAKVGIDDLLMHLTGPVKITPFAQSGDTISKGNLLADIDHNGKSLKILSPVSGEIISINPVLQSNPEVLNQDPLKQGWICRIKPTNWIAETQTYYLAEKATAWTDEELVKIKDFLASTARGQNPGMQQLILQDGGELRDNTLSELPKETWQDFQNRFLSHLD
ncbi:MAG: hypothetical protein A2X22_08040 [Bacteroidetes bacterium GWF2_49_14]|nr:MAG: hypothetical protein A2X22_08040 [Bacteroidetes bacterium GWF2_49_14]HBB91056.1 hypothetical protein [Bacteroidales bacterium]